MEISKRDREILHELAQKYMTCASPPIQKEKRELWRNLNRLHMQKPMVAIDQIPADMVLDPYILIDRPIKNSGYGVEIITETLDTDASNSVKAQNFTNQFEEPEDIEKIKTPIISIDRAYEAELRETARRFLPALHR